MSCIRLIVFLYVIQQVYSHGYLADPPARSSAWLYDRDFQSCCSYYEHMQMFCGGTDHQWVKNGGKCSICGEPYDRETKLFSMGGAKYLGKIVRTYTQGSVIPVTVILTANHLGLFEFRVCSIDNDPSQDATQSCLDLNLLNTTNGSTKYRITSNLSTVRLELRLPSELICKHCVFQWRYQTGNSWGVSNGRGCLGCGRENEEFYGCSDISIIPDEKLVENSTKITMTDEPSSIVTTKEAIINTRNCTPSVAFSQTFDLSDIMERYCQTICSNDCASDKKIGDENLYNNCVNSCSKLCVCD